MLRPAKSKIATKQKSDLLYKAILKLETEGVLQLLPGSVHHFGDALHGAAF